MKRMKFCHLIDASTANPLLYNSVKYSDREYFDYTVISFAPNGGLQAEMRGLGVETFSLECLSRKQYPATIARLIRYFRREKFDIVQVHSFEASLVGLIAARLAGVPVRIFSGHHSHEVPLYNNPRLLFVDGFLSRRLATSVLAPSGNMRDIFAAAQKVPPSMIETIPHGMDLNAWRTAANKSSGIKKEFGIEDKIIFGAVGRLFWVKGFDTLIKAFAEVAARRADIALLIVGDGADKAHLQNLIDSLKIERRIFLTGKRADIAAVMNDFDVFVHTALAESFGLVFPEAFALGKPIISTRVGAAIDIIEDGANGLLINSDDANDLTAAFEKMLSMRDRWTAMGEHGRRITENFAVEITQAQCDEYCRRLAE